MDATQARALARKLRILVSLTVGQRAEMARGLEELADLQARVAELEAALAEYEGMMTRRKVLERIVAYDGYGRRRENSCAVWWDGHIAGMSATLDIRGRIHEQVYAAAHELALLMARDREGAPADGD